MESTILNIKMINSYPTSRDMTIFEKSPWQQIFKLHFIAINFEIIVQNQQKLYILIALVSSFLKI